MARPAQKAAVTLAFAAAALSFIAVAIELAASGEISVTPLIGGVFMLALAIAGVFKLRNPDR